MAATRCIDNSGHEMRKCRFCEGELSLSLVDLGVQPLANSFLISVDQAIKEAKYPLHVRICENCYLVQVDKDVPAGDIFTDYAYFSSMSSTWLEHAAAYADMMINRFRLGNSSLVVEVASNDGYLLKQFVSRGIPVLGIEPAKNVANECISQGINTEITFFNRESAKVLKSRGIKSDLIVANNVLAHVPDINGFVAGFPLLLAEEGVITFEFPHLLNLIIHGQFDTIYHEHYSYLSLLTAEKIFLKHGLRIFDVDEVPTHGGSLRVYLSHLGASHKSSDNLERIIKKEKSANLDTLKGYSGFQKSAQEIRDQLLKFLRDAKENNLKVVAYGAAAKGNTLLNYCDIDGSLIGAVFDKSPYKQGKFLPGSHIPILSVNKIRDHKPDNILILPWNFADEIMNEHRYIKDWGGKFVIAIPELKVF